MINGFSGCGYWADRAAVRLQQFVAGRRPRAQDSLPLTKLITGEPKLVETTSHESQWTQTAELLNAGRGTRAVLRRADYVT